MVIRKFGEDKSKTLGVGLIKNFPQNFLVGVITLCLSKPLHLLQTTIV